MKLINMMSISLFLGVIASVAGVDLDPKCK